MISILPSREVHECEIAPIFVIWTFFEGEEAEAMSELLRAIVSMKTVRECEYFRTRSNQYRPR